MWRLCVRNLSLEVTEKPRSEYPPTPSFDTRRSLSKEFLRFSPFSPLSPRKLKFLKVSHIVCINWPRDNEDDSRRENEKFC